MDAPFALKTQDPVMSSNAKSKHAPPTIPVPSSTNGKCDGKANLTEKGVKASNTNNVHKMCSSHVLKPVTRLITQM